ncbi:MAG: carbohydrate-binding family 6 protein [Planctomycetota bacterium]|jgi:hypothetical protein
MQKNLKSQLKQIPAKRKGFDLRLDIGHCIFVALLICCSFSCSELRADTVTLLVDSKNPQAAFASEDITKALRAKGLDVKKSPLKKLDKIKQGTCIVLSELSNAVILNKMRAAGARPSKTLKSEGYSIRTTSGPDRKTCWVIGADAAGLMYGGLDIPLDARSPSYTDLCDAGQNNIPEMWSFDFWKTYIDNLVRYRFNFISCWSLHPFPSLVRVPDYPDIALNDVKRSTVKWKENYDLSGRGFDSPEILDNLETLKKITIDEKIAFWRKVMQYAKNRNIDFYFVTWNIFVNGTYGKYDITDSITNETTTDYFRKSVKQMFLTYPLLKGIGLTTGENMGRASFQQKEDWAFNTYAQGVLDALKEQPGRKITFIHRQHQTGAKDIARKFAPLIDHKDVEFIFSFKYAKAHVYSSTTQVYHPGFVEDITEDGNLKTIWTLRNDDVYHFRWGAPDFVREFIENIPYEVSRGFYFGSDQYIWGREFMSKEPDSPRQIEIVKHWYHWMIWGRLGYNPKVTNERFTAIIQQRFPSIKAADLFTTWQHASMVYPKTTGFHWGSLDFQWYIESCKSRPGPAQTKTGFHDVNRFITLPPHKGTGYISIPDYVKSVVEKTKLPGTTPIELSDQIHDHADKALKILSTLSHDGNKELRLTLGDIRAMAYMGKYYAHKIRGATELAIARKTKNAESRKAAARQLQFAAEYWFKYVSVALSQYKNPLWFNRVGYVDWEKLTNQVLGDIVIAAQN